MTVKKDYYAILGVEKTASDQDIKKAYRKLAMRYHPDKNPGNQKAEETFKSLTEAYDVLSDPKKRQNFDRFGHQDPPYQGGYKKSSHYSYQGGFGNKSYQQESYQDIFEDVFGDLFRNNQSQKPKKGADLKYHLRLTLEEASQGTQKLIHFLRQRNSLATEAKLSVNIPPGVKSGQKLRLPLEGDDLGLGSQPGDLFVIIEMLPHPLFVLEDYDIILDLPVTFLQALTGAEIEIPTLKGKVIVKVPPGSTSGTILRIKNKGFPSSKAGSYGDMRVKLLVDIPTQLTEEERKVFEDMGKKLGDTPKVKEFKDKVQQVLNMRS
jgi:molecular chaperone DnaJ